MEEIIKVELFGAKRIIENNPKNCLAWYLGCVLWNRILTSLEDFKIVEEIGRPSNVDLGEEGFTITPEFDLHQPLRKLN